MIKVCYTIFNEHSITKENFMFEQVLRNRRFAYASVLISMNFFFNKSFVYQNPKDMALSIGKQAPIPNQIAVINPIIKTKLAMGRRNGF